VLNLLRKTESMRSNCENNVESDADSSVNDEGTLLLLSIADLKLHLKDPQFQKTLI
jgi:hypothetical protein